MIENFELLQKDVKKQIIELIDCETHPILMAIIEKADISHFKLYEPWGIKGERLHIEFFGPEGTIEYNSERWKMSKIDFKTMNQQVMKLEKINPRLFKKFADSLPVAVKNTINGLIEQRYWSDNRYAIWKMPEN